LTKLLKNHINKLNLMNLFICIVKLETRNYTFLEVVFQKINGTQSSITFLLIIFKLVLMIMKVLSESTKYNRLCYKKRAT